MEAQPDFSELLALFNEERVEFLLIGAYALAHHGVVRSTGDLDIWLRPTPENADSVLRALERFGFGELDLSHDDFLHPDRVVQLGQPPVRIDLMTSISGVDWAEARAGAEPSTYGSIPVHVLGLTDLVRNKRATGRLKDLADLESLGE